MTTVKKTQTAAAAPQGHGIRMPTNAEMTSAYRSICEGVEKAGTAKKLAKAPAGADKAPKYNITRPGILGVSKTCYVIKGEMYVKTQVVSPTAKPAWVKIGPAPMF
jgi:hypothetical protein